MYLNVAVCLLIYFIRIFAEFSGFLKKKKKGNNQTYKYNFLQGFV